MGLRFPERQALLCTAAAEQVEVVDIPPGTRYGLAEVADPAAAQSLAHLNMAALVGLVGRPEAAPQALNPAVVAAGLIAEHPLVRAETAR